MTHELDQADADLANAAARLIELAIQIARVREPEQMGFLERLRTGDGLNLGLAAVIPASDPASLNIEVALCRPSDGEVIARLMSITARKEGTPCGLH